MKKESTLEERINDCQNVMPRKVVTRNAQNPNRPRSRR